MELFGDATFDYEALDPGIRAAVRHLRAHGFETTDSGDGVSKPADWFESGEALRVPHVFASTTRDRLTMATIRMQVCLDAWEPNEWRVEGSYSAADDSSVLCAYRNQRSVVESPAAG